MGQRKYNLIFNTLFSLILFSLLFLFSSHFLPGAFALDFITNTDSVTVPEGGTATFQVQLDEDPIVPVIATVTRLSGGGNDTDISASPAFLTFNSSNWNINHPVTVSAAEDPDVVDGEATIRVNAPGIQRKDVLARENDNDTLNFVTNTNSVTVPEGGTTSFQVQLSADPAGPVTATVTRVSGGDTDISSSPTTLTFNSSNWNIDHPVTVSASEDPDGDDGTATIRVNATGIPRKDVLATENDNDDLIFVTDPSSVTVTEGDTATFRVRLGAQPASNVNASVSRASGDISITVQSGSSLTFTTSDWNNFQEVTLFASEDNDANNGTANIRVSDDAGVIPNKNVNATESDNDTLEFVTDTDSVTVPEGGTAQFMVKLGAQPDSDFDATVNRIDGDSDITVQSGSPLSFTTTNWETFQPVTLGAADDNDGLNSTGTFQISAQGLPSKEIVATEGDDDTITILIPNGGEIWPIDTAQEISWMSGGTTGSSVSIDLLKGEQPDRTIIPNTPNNGSFTWDIPSDLLGSIEHRIRITSTSDLTITDESDGDFTIAGVELDSDGDGVLDIVEMGPFRDDPGYDGNNDGAPDNLENNVASFPTFDESHYVTLEGETSIDSVQAIPPPPGAPEDMFFPYGFFDFSISGLAAGEATTVTLYVDSIIPETYFKFGATPENPTPSWYEFIFDPVSFTGVNIDGFVTNLFFVDGGRGDDDLLANGILVDQGGPGTIDPESVGKDCFIATAAFGSPSAPYIQVLREFRDRRLLTNKGGTWLVKQYYRYSPPLAEWLTKHEVARSAVRMLLIPIIATAWLTQYAGLTISLITVLIIAGCLVLCAARPKRRLQGYRANK